MQWQQVVFQPQNFTDYSGIVSVFIRENPWLIRTHLYPWKSVAENTIWASRLVSVFIR